MRNIKRDDDQTIGPSDEMDMITKERLEPLLKAMAEALILKHPTPLPVTFSLKFRLDRLNDPRNGELMLDGFKAMFVHAFHLGRAYGSQHQPSLQPPLESVRAGVPVEDDLLRQESERAERRNARGPCGAAHLEDDRCPREEENPAGHDRSDAHGRFDADAMNGGRGGGFVRLGASARQARSATAHSSSSVVSCRTVSPPSAGPPSATVSPSTKCSSL